MDQIQIPPEGRHPLLLPSWGTHVSSLWTPHCEPRAPSLVSIKFPTKGDLTSSSSSNPTAAFTTSDTPCHSFPITGDTHTVCGPLICSTVSMALAHLPSAVSHASRQTQDSWKCQVAGGLLFPLLVCLSHPLSCSGSEQLSMTAPSACVPCGSRCPSPLVSDTPISVSVPLFSSSMESTGAPTFSRMTHIRQSLLRLLCVVLCLLWAGGMVEISTAC